MEIMKSILFLLGIFTLTLTFTFGILNFFNYGHLFVKEDIFRIPNRFLKEFTMNDKEIAILELKEYKKLRACIDSLDLLLKNKQRMLWDIESQEKQCTVNLSMR